jgi:hypothetical protein
MKRQANQGAAPAITCLDEAEYVRVMAKQNGGKVVLKRFMPRPLAEAYLEGYMEGQGKMFGQDDQWTAWIEPVGGDD